MVVGDHPCPEAEEVVAVPSQASVVEVEDPFRALEAVVEVHRTHQEAGEEAVGPYLALEVGAVEEGLLFAQAASRHAKAVGCSV